MALRVPPVERVPDGEDEFHELTAADAFAASAAGADEGLATRPQRLPLPGKGRTAEAEELQEAFRAGVASALRVDSGRGRGRRAGPRDTMLRRRPAAAGGQMGEEEQDSDGSSESLLSGEESDDDMAAVDAADVAEAAAAAVRHAAKLNPEGAFWRLDVATGQAVVHVPLRSAPPTGAMVQVTDLEDMNTPVPMRYAKAHPDPHGARSRPGSTRL